MSNNIHQLRRVMMRANYLYSSNIILLRGANLSRREKQKVSLKLAWYFEHFRDMLASGIYRFSYFKKDGGIREAVGTLNFDLIPEEHHPKSLSAARSDSSENSSSFCYYDFYADGDTGGWRSFCLELFIGFVEQV